MRRTVRAMLMLAAATGMSACQAEVPGQANASAHAEAPAHADVSVLGVRISAKDVTALAKFYDRALGLKEILHYGEPVSEIITRYGVTVAAAKAGSGGELVIEHRESGPANDPTAHAIIRVPDIATAMAAAEAAGAKMEDKVFSATIAGSPVKLSRFIDPEGNHIELMELPEGLQRLNPKL